MACAFLWHFRKTGDMAPKGNKRATSELGHVFPHDNGYRVQAQIDGKKERGPCRCTQAAAKQDLRKAQAADNHKQYADVLKQLREAAKSAASEAPSGVTQPAASASQQQASATTFEKQCQQILDYRRAHGGRAPCQNRFDSKQTKPSIFKVTSFKLQHPTSTASIAILAQAIFGSRDAASGWRAMSTYYARLAWAVNHKRRATAASQQT